jgi:hypothetical protein
LDTLLEAEGITQVDLLKVDVEGFEAGVFQGAEGLLTGTRPPVVLFEFCDWAEERTLAGSIGEAQRILLDWGYTLWRLTDYMRRRSALTATVMSGTDMLIAVRKPR